MIFNNTTKLNAALGAGLLGILITLNPGTCQAQMEINPDHCDTTADSGAPTKARSNRSLSSFRGASNHAAPQKPSAGKSRLGSKKLSSKHQHTQLSAKAAPSDRSWDVR